jgi:NitT/TauT family transport system substrate-binding protein
MMRRLLIALFALALLATACSSDDAETTTEDTVEDATTTTAAPADETTEAPAETEAPTTTEAMEEEVVEECTEFKEATMLVVNNMAHLPSFYAQDFGLWADRCLNIDFQILGGGADIAAGLKAGQAEFGAVNGGTGVAPQRAGGLLTKLVAPYNNDATNAKYVDWISIIGRVDSGLTEDPASIKGMKVGVTGGGTPNAYLTEWLKINDMTKDDIEIVAMGAPDMLTAIVNGDVDAVVPWDPFRTSALRQLGDNGVDMSPGEDLVLSTIGLGAVDGEMAANPEVYKAFIEGIVEATFLIRQDPASAAPVVLSFVQGVTEEDAITAMERNVYDPRISICTEWGVEVTAQQLVDAGSIEVDEPFTSDDLLDASLLDEVLAEHPEWIADLPALPETVEECTGYDG